MDFGGGAIASVTLGHGSHVAEKGRMWGGFEDDILIYLSDIKNLEQFADKANNAQELSARLDPFLSNAEKMLEAMAELSKGQATWTDLRAKYGVQVANAIASIRQTNAKFDAEMQTIDAKDRANIARIEQKRQNSLVEIGTQLSQDLNAELFRHQQAITGINNRHVVQEQRQVAMAGIREQRQALMERARNGSKALGSSQLQEVIPVTLEKNVQPPRSGVSATGTPRGWGPNLKDLWNNLGTR